MQPRLSVYPIGQRNAIRGSLRDILLRQVAMASPATSLASGLASTIGTFALVIVCAGVVAFVAARKWGSTKRSPQAIFGVVGFAGLAIAVLVAQLRLRGIG